MFRRPASLRAGKRFAIYLALVVEGVLVFASTCSAQLTGSLSPLATFGGGDGWLAPGEYDYGYLLNGNLERGLAYGNGHLYLVSRQGATNSGNNIRILDPAIGLAPDGTDLGQLNIGTGIIGGGTFGVNMVGVGGDGAIYVGNLQTNTLAGTNLFKVYKWANESSTPTVAYSGDAGLTGARIGDDLSVIGSGSSTRIVSGFSNTAVSGTNGYSVIDPTAGTATAVSFTGTPPNSGDFRLGITFTDANHVIGAQQPAGITNGFYRYSSFSGNSGTLLASPDLLHSGGATAERQMAYDVINGHPVLAMQSTGDSHVAIYSLADPANPVFLVSGNNTVLPLSNPNANGSIAWGPTVNNGDGTYSATLYAMSTNQGIQAFTFTLSSTVVPVAGDYNGNGKVDAGDYVLWRNTLGQSVTAGTGADGNGDGIINTPDFDVWRSKFGNTSGSGSLAGANVPEPGTLVGCCVAFGLISTLGRRRIAN